MTQFLAYYTGESASPALFCENLVKQQ